MTPLICGRTSDKSQAETRPGSSLVKRHRLGAQHDVADLRRRRRRRPHAATARAPATSPASPGSSPRGGLVKRPSEGGTASIGCSAELVGQRGLDRRRRGLFPHDAGTPIAGRCEQSPPDFLGRVG